MQSKAHSEYEEPDFKAPYMAVLQANIHHAHQLSELLL